MQRRRLLLGTAAAAGVATLPAMAQMSGTWPQRPIRLLVGFPGGSTPDMAARALADPLAAALGQPVVVDNKAGAAGNIAADQVAKSNDDHTLGVVINGNLTSAKMLNPRLPYDPARDFAYLSLLTTAPLVLVTPAGQPSGAAFFAEARKQGNAWNYGSVGTGSVAHLGMELLKSKMPGFQAEHIPFGGNPQVITAILSGEIQLALMPPGVVLPHIQSGRLQAIGLTSGRSLLAPAIAPLTDSGVRDYALEVWTALVGPAKLSTAARQRLGQEVPRIMRTPETRQRLFRQGWQAVGTAPEGLQQRVQQETEIMAAMIRVQRLQSESSPKS